MVALKLIFDSQGSKHLISKNTRRDFEMDKLKFQISRQSFPIINLDRANSWRKNKADFSITFKRGLSDSFFKTLLVCLSTSSELFEPNRP